jgi:carbon storage regulator
MLVLSRRINEVIVINDDIQVIVSGVRGNVVKLGIEAPREVPIRRLELLDRAERGMAKNSGGEARR